MPVNDIWYTKCENAFRSESAPASAQSKERLQLRHTRESNRFKADGNSHSPTDA